MCGKGTAICVGAPDACHSVENEAPWRSRFAVNLLRFSLSIALVMKDPQRATPPGILGDSPRQ